MYSNAIVGSLCIARCGSHIFDEGGENGVSSAELSQQGICTGTRRQSCLHKLIQSCQQCAQLQSHCFFHRVLLG